MSGPYDLFVCHDAASASQVKRLTSALGSSGVSFQLLGGRDSGREHPELAQCKALLIWATAAFFTSRECQTQLASAYLAYQQEPPGSPARILIINAEAGCKHLYPLFLRDLVIGEASQLNEPPAFASLAEKLRSHCACLSKPLGSLIPHPTSGWVEPYDRLTRKPAYFIDRERELWDIHETLFPHTPTAGHHREERVILSAQVGQGKSTLAREYAFRFGAAYPGGRYRLSARDARPALSIRALAENPALKPQLLALLREINPKTLLEESARLEVIRQALADALEQAGQAFLWIVDEIPDDLNGPSLMQWFAPQGDQRLGRTLLISRSHRYDNRGHPIHLPCLDESAGWTVITRGHRPGRPDEKLACGWLVDAVVRHARFTVMLGMLARSLGGKKRGPGFFKLLRRLEKRNRRAEELAARHPQAFPSEQADLAAAILLEALQALGQPARTLLVLASQLAEAPLPGDFLAECLIYSGLSIHPHREPTLTGLLDPSGQRTSPTRETTLSKVEEGAAQLERFALAQRSHITLDLYSGAIQAIRDQAIEPGIRNTVREAALQAIYRIAEGCTQSQDWRPLTVMAPHARKLLGDLQQRNIDPEETIPEITGRIQLALCLAALDLKQGERQRAIQLYLAANSYLTKALAAQPDHESHQRDFALIQERLGDLMSGSGELATALDHYRKCLGVRTFMAKQCEDELKACQELLCLHEKIGAILCHLGELDKALQSYHAAHGLIMRLSEESPEDQALQFSLASSYQRLARIQTRLDQNGSAMSALRKALPLLEKLAKNHPESLDHVRPPILIHSMIGSLARAQNDLSSALESFRQALEIAEYCARLDSQSPHSQRDIALCHDSLGDTLAKLDDPVEAQNHYLAYLRIAENPANLAAFSGARQSDIALVKIKLGRAREMAKDTDTALSLYLSAQGLLEQGIQENARDESLRRNLAWLTKKIDRLEERLESDRRRLARRRRT